jgi:hypothetical protein
MLAALLAVLSWGQGDQVSATFPRLPLQVRVQAERGFDMASVGPAMEVARRLLASAGIDMVWRLCPPAGCESRTSPPSEVYVILTSRALSERGANCGVAFVGTAAGVGTVKASLPCVVDFAARFSARNGGAPHPLLFVARHDDLLGAVVAHEIGHVLGLRHGEGVMRARLDPSDVVALRRGTLAFAPGDCARMREVVQGSTR